MLSIGTEELDPAEGTPEDAGVVSWSVLNRREITYAAVKNMLIPGHVKWKDASGVQTFAILVIWTLTTPVAMKVETRVEVI